MGNEMMNYIVLPLAMMVIVAAAFCLGIMKLRQDEYWTDVRRKRIEIWGEEAILAEEDKRRKLPWWKKIL